MSFTETLFPLRPSILHRPEILGDDPSLRPLGDPVGAIGKVRELEAIESPDRSTLLTPQGPQNDLASLRCRFPFLAILPIPTTAASVLLTANPTIAGLFQGEMNIPDGMVLGMFNANGTVFVSRNGAAEVPTAVSAGQSLGFGQASSFMLFNGSVFYVGGIRSLSFAGPVASIVTAMLYAPDQLPR